MWNPFKRSVKKTDDDSADDDLKKSFNFAVALKQALGSGQPGQWSSDHRAESGQYTGWSYVAIRAICLQAMQATVSVYDDSTDGARRRSLRKSMRGDPGAKRLKSLYAGEEGESEPLPNDHPLCKLLKRPNPTQSGANFRFERVMQLQLTGTSLVWNVPNRFGKTVHRYVIPTAMATPVQPRADLPEGGFRINSTSNRYAAVDEDGFTSVGIHNLVVGSVVPLGQIQVTRWPHPILKEDGQSPISAGAKWIDSANQIDSARWAQMNNGADPSVVITVDKDLNPTEEELEAAAEKFNQKYGGTENTGKAIFSTDGKVVALTTTPKDMSYVEAFEQFRDSILGLHGVPGVAAGITEGGSYAAYYASLKQFTGLTVQPILDLIAEEDTEELAPQFGEGLTVDIEAAEIDDPEVLERRIATDVTAQSITRDEVRALRGLPPLGSEKGGDQLAGPQAPVPFGSSNAGAIPNPSASGNYADETTTGQAGPPTPGSSEPGLKPAAGAEQLEEVAAKSNVQSTALNGAQVTSLIDLATSMSSQQLPPESVKALIIAAFPLMEESLIDSILNPLLTFTPPGDETIGKSHRFLTNGKATAKAQEILKNWRDYPGGRP